jgi:type I restriction enzyme S subunit
LSGEYLYYFLLQDSFRIEGERTMSGAVGHKRVSKEFIERCPIPLPPLLEQQRIVSVLDDAREKSLDLEAIYRQQLENIAELREAILRKAFCGELSTPPSQATKEAAE